MQAWHDGMNRLRVNTTLSTGPDTYADEKYQIQLALGAMDPIPTLFQGAIL